ncbi:MAG TPA: N-acetylmuramic acid 6-phosphate etherase [Saprospiraceae bacterium]|nr:N-acetylmuramic acid 6-phosphate etherase [Saprospiraceae bacterium]HPQ21730.1 N-acetylmuramic acid 6-phosphate etherase [Saprospiraceae bacterium]HRX28491.1 N-acetylmuramic acid 6-phosphate etherase [Saprospiraceae bacterium]
MKITEQDGKHRGLEKKSIKEIISDINELDKEVPIAVEKKLDQIELTVQAIVEKLQNGGRLFYIGAGTSGRLGVLDASECPPTFGVSHDIVIGLIAGGDNAIRKAVENAEDDYSLAIQDLMKYKISSKDFVIGIAASGTTPYVLGGVKACQERGISTACICCNEDTPLAALVDYPIEVVVGPEYVRGSTRMRAGTAQKLVLNMISTSVMIKLGRVHDNKMVDMQLNNNKLFDRGVKMIVELSNLDEESARKALLDKGSVRRVLDNLK